MEQTQIESFVAARTARSENGVPLVVDLDGTLLRSDTLEEVVVRHVIRSPWRLVWAVFVWLFRGRAGLKAWLFQDHGIQVDRLPYDERVLAWLEEERRNGRNLVLATGTDLKVAREIADHLQMFGAVFASDGKTNLKGKRKAERLVQECPGGFDYAGNSRNDVEVWERARAAVLVNAPPSVSRKARSQGNVTREFPPARGTGGC